MLALLIHHFTILSLKYLYSYPSIDEKTIISMESSGLFAILSTFDD